MRWTLERATSGPVRQSELAEARGASFDARFGVSTRGVVSLADLEIEGATWKHGHRYQATDADLFAEVAAQLGRAHLAIDHRKYAFVDLGCGKGRVLMLAAELPFARVIGVEFSPELAASARENLQRSRMARRSGPVEVLCQDVLDFELPEQPLVLFLYDPFEAAVMEPFVRRLEASLRRAPRDAVVLYVEPTQRDLWRAGLLDEVRCTPDWAVFRAPADIRRPAAQAPVGTADPHRA
jgi:SAM-dependent methyltransferase